MTDRLDIGSDSANLSNAGRRINNPLLTLWNRQDIPVDTKGPVDTDQLKEEMGLNLDRNLRPIKPNMEGTVAFDRVWDTNANFLETIIQTAKLKMLARARGLSEDEIMSKIAGPPRENDLMDMGAIARNAFHVLRGMQAAHPITVDPEQIDAIPDWESVEECVDYATHARLPFDCIFLDCELPTRKPRNVGLRLFGDTYQLIGGLAAIEEGTLILVPFGRILNKDRESVFRIDERGGTKTVDGRMDVTYFSWGAVSFNLHHDPAATREDEAFNNASVFRESEAQTLNLKFRLWDMDFGWLTQQMANSESADPDTFRFDHESNWPHPPSPCRIHLIPPTSEHPDSRVAGMTAALFAGASEMLKVLYFLDTPNIEVVDAQLSRQVRRQAERSGAQIAKTIFVRHNTKRYPRKDDEDVEHTEYSHRFEVRGHWKYYPEGTQMADARPDLLRYVPGRGMCRKIWCPPHVKGPEDKPLVPKTRRVREDSHA